MSPLIKLTAVQVQNASSTQYYDPPTVILVNPYKIMAVIPNKKDLTEIRDEVGRNTLVVKETPEEIYDLINIPEDL